MTTIAAQLESEYGWRTTSAFTDASLTLLLQAAQTLRAFADEILPGGGLAWMRRWLSPVYFHLGGLPQQVVSWVGHQKTSVVFPARDVWLSPTFTGIANPRQHLIHELAHVLDNRQAKRSLPATFFGGGPADRLALEMGGAPKGIRFSNGVCGIPPANQWSPAAGGGYGNHATAEYFAESVAWTLLYPVHLPAPSIISWLEANVFSVLT